MIFFLRSIYVNKPVLERQIFLSGYFICKCYLCSNNLTPDTLPSTADPILEVNLKKLHWFNYVLKAVTEETQGIAVKQMLEKFSEVIAFMRENSSSFNAHLKEAYEYGTAFEVLLERLCFLLMYPYRETERLDYNLSDLES